MTLTDDEFRAILEDDSKEIIGNIAWQEDEDHSLVQEFRVDVASAEGWPLTVRGSFNSLIPAVSYVIIHKPAGRIYALDLGKDHHNPDCERVGEKHKHRWTQLHRDKQAYVPNDITAAASDPVGVWAQFCAEARISHKGKLSVPSPTSGDLFI